MGWTAERLGGWLIPALLALLVVYQLGYTYGDANQTLLLPWILRRIDPSLLANDWFATTIPHHLNFVRFLAWAARVAPLPLVMAAFHVLFLILSLWAARRLAGELFSDRRVFYVAVFLLLRWGASGLGGNGLWANSLLPHHASAAACLAAFFLALRGRLVWAAAAAAAATWIHIQLGALTMLVLGAGMLLDWRRTGARPVLLAGSLYLTLVAPAIVPQWQLYVGAPSAFSARQFLDTHAVLRQPHHLIPSSWPGADYYRFGLALALAALGLGSDWRRRPHRSIVIWTALILALGLAGWIFVELIPIKLVIKMQLFRMTIFVKFFALLYAARFLLAALEEPGTWQRICALAILAIQNFAAVGMCASLIFARRQNRRWIWGLGLFAAGAVAGVAAVATASLGTPIPMFWHSFAVSPRGMWIGPLTLAGLAGVLWGAWKLGRPGLFPASLLALVAVVRTLTGLPFFGYDHPPADEWYRFCRRVRDLTPRDAVVITPPYLGGFSAFAERAQVADFKCAPSMERDLAEWKRRMDDLAGVPDLRCSGWIECGTELAGGYEKLREADFLALAAKYRATYAVLSQPGHQLHFPELLRSGDLVLYRIPVAGGDRR